MDSSIQCRASYNKATVTDYAERMSCEDEFPPIVLFGTETKSWIGDGWHRILAARQIGAVGILAEINPGGRAEALKYALGANSAHGIRRTNADKRRCVEIALREFPKLSSRAIAELCGVSPQTVSTWRDNDVSKLDTSTRTDTLGRQQPAHKPHRPEPEPAEDDDGPDDAEPVVPTMEEIADAAVAHVGETGGENDTHDDDPEDDYVTPFDAREFICRLKRAIGDVMLLWPKDEDLEPIIVFLESQSRYFAKIKESNK